MKVEIRVTNTFSKRAKPLLKKYSSLINELEVLERELSDNPHLGQPLGNDSYKIRLSIQSKGKGKSGEARIITHLDSEIVGTLEKGPAGESTVYFLTTIYDKAETASISSKELKELFKKKS
jgi:mRNA-degrading endonuclease RelE of RelBE toxin-antitoxin system